MRRIWNAYSASWIVAAFCVLCCGTAPQTGAQTAPTRTPVLVELFTSEGCSTCPPADELLDDLIKRQPIPGVLVVGLGEHVDYWNQLGWTDRFSSSSYSQRQGVYAKNMKSSQVYTPQMVINGTREALGSNRTDVVRAISAAAKETTATLTVSRAAAASGAIQLSVTLSGAGHDSPELYVAITDDDDVTMVTGGENGGQSLRYTSAVRSLRSYGPIAEGQPKTVEIKLPPDAAKKKMHVVAFAQLSGQGRVIAVAIAAI